MKILVSTSSVKLEDKSIKVSVVAGKATKTKPAMAAIVVSSGTKKEAAKITFKPTAEATIEKPKYEARLNALGKGFRMKNAADCIASLKVHGFDPKDGKPIRDFYAGKITAAEFKKAMGTKTYTHKDDVKVAETVKHVNSVKLPSAGKGKITRKMVDKVFASFQTIPFANDSFVKAFMKACENHNNGKLTKAQLTKVSGIFSKRATRQPKLAAMRKAYDSVIDTMRSGLELGNAKPASANTGDSLLPNVTSKRLTSFITDMFEEGKLKTRDISAINTILGKLTSGSATPKEVQRVKDILTRPAGSHPRLLGMAIHEVEKMQMKAGVSNVIDPKTEADFDQTTLPLSARISTSPRSKGEVIITGSVLPTSINDGVFGTHTSFGETYVSTKAKAMKSLRKNKGFSKTHEALINDLVDGAVKPRAFVAAFNKIAKAPTRGKEPAAPASKVQGNVVTDGNLSVELPTDSKLTAGEANKIMGYFSSMIGKNQVAKAQCTRALKDLASGEMTKPMKKRWLDRISESDIRPVPRKLVSLLRETSGAASASTPRARNTTKGGAARPTANSTPHAIAKAITAAGFKGVLAARQRGDLVEIYNKEDNAVVWSWNRKTLKAINYTSSKINQMYSTIDLDAMAQGKKVSTVKDILQSL